MICKAETGSRLQIIGVIMTGGLNRRMNGRIKLFMETDGIPNWERLSDAMTALPEIVLSVNTTEPYKQIGLPMIVDEIEKIGPIGGLASVMHQKTADAYLIAASDMPFLTQEAAGRMIRAYRQTGKCTIARSVPSGKIHPLFGVYPAAMIGVIERHIEEKNYRMMSLAEEIDPVLVDFPDEDPVLTNVNSL